MTDRELLELAAKAAGIEVLEFAHGGIISKYPCGHIWNSLEDDGDALRLAVKLNLWVHIEKYGTSARKAGGAWTRCESQIHGGIEQATRSAITRAAAEIGRASQAAEERKS